MAFPSKKHKVRHRFLQVESLETREMLSVTLADLPVADFAESDSAYVADQNVVKAENTLESENGTTFAAEETVNLAPPKSARPAYTATPTTLTVNWSSPIASKSLNTDQITHFEVTIINAKTKQVVKTQTVGADERSALFEGLDFKTRYQVTVTSKGGDGTSSDRATLKITATTAAFPLVTVKASKKTLTTMTLTVTDKDKITSFVNGETVKHYTIEYVEKTRTVDWSSPQKIEITPGTAVTDTKKGTVSTTVAGLTPGVQYAFRVIATYTDGVTVENEKTIVSEGRTSTARTNKLPAVSLSGSSFSVLDKTDYEFAIGMNGKIANYAKLESGITISYSLLVSTSTKIDKSTGKLEKSQTVTTSNLTTIDPKGGFSIDPVSLESIVAKLGRDAVLGTKTLGFQLVLTFTFEDGTVATQNSKVGRSTLPTWYTPA